MTQVNCIIIDDDIFSTKIVTGYISRTPGVVLVQSFGCAVDAINFLSTPEGNAVNLIFLDIEMPDLSGIDFMRAVDLRDKEVVIYSSQEKYALESYEYDVCDYLLKPVAYPRFIKAISKARVAMGQKANAEEEEDPTNGNFVMVRDNVGSTHKVNVSDVILIAAEQNYVSVKTTKGEIWVHIPMKKILEMMPEPHICRIHRSFAVGIRYISRMDKDTVSVESGGKSLDYPLSRSYSQNLKTVLANAKEGSV